MRDAVDDPRGRHRARDDDLVRAAAAHGESTFHLDQVALTEARPDVILGQTLCAVCAVTLDQVPTFLDRPPLVVALDASTIAGMLQVCAKWGRPSAGPERLRTSCGSSRGD